MSPERRFGTHSVPANRRNPWAGEDSNLRLTDYESAALTAELPAPARRLAAPGEPPRELLVGGEGEYDLAPV